MKGTSWVITGCAIAFSGCSKVPDESHFTSQLLGGDASTPANSSPAKSSKRPAKSAGSHDFSDLKSPQDVVNRFLDAARNREQDVVEQLLTQAARTEAKRAELTIEPPGTPAMVYEVAQAEYPTEDSKIAYVKVKWTETDDKDAEVSEILWILRKESVGWRVAGMSVPQDDDERPYTLSFEKPADMLEIKRHVQLEPETPANQFDADEGRFNNLPANTLRRSK